MWFSERNGAKTPRNKENINFAASCLSDLAYKIRHYICHITYIECLIFYKMEY